MARTNSENEYINQAVNDADSSLTGKSQASDSNHSGGVLESPATLRSDTSTHRSPAPRRGSKLVSGKFVYRAKRAAAGGTLDPREVLQLHQRVLTGELFLNSITETIESSAGAKKMLLAPFSSDSMRVGSKQITSSLFAIALSNPKDGEPVLKVTTRGKSPGTAKLLGNLIRQTYFRMLAEEDPAAPVLPTTAQLATDLRRKEAEIEGLREQIQQKQSAKPVSSVNEITLRAELEQCEAELASDIAALAEIQKARENGASIENLAVLPSLSRKGNLSECITNLEQLRKLRSSTTGSNAAVREEQERQIAQTEHNLEVELLAIVTAIKEHCAKTMTQRNTVRASLVEMAKVASALREDSPRLKLLARREREAEILQNRYDLALSKWQEAKALLAADSELEESKK